MKEPTSGEKSPKDAARDLPEGARPPKDGEQGDPRSNAQPPWVAALPPEIRDALAGGRAEDVPEKYRHLIRAWNLWLQKNAKAK